MCPVRQLGIASDWIKLMILVIYVYVCMFVCMYVCMIPTAYLGGRGLIVTYIFGHMLPQKCNLHF